MLHSLISAHPSYSLAPHLTFISLSNTRGHNLKIKQPIIKLYPVQTILLSRTAYEWNTLSEHVLQARSCSAFPSLVSEHISQRDTLTYQPIHRFN